MTGSLPLMMLAARLKSRTFTPASAGGTDEDLPLGAGAEFFENDRTHHQRGGAEQRFDATRHPFGISDRLAHDVDRDHDLGRIEKVERDRIGDAAVDHDTPADADRLEQHRHRRGGGDRREERAFAEHDLHPGIIVGGNHLKGKRSSSKLLASVPGMNAASTRSRSYWPNPEIDLADPPRPQLPKPSEKLGAAMEDAEGVVADFRAAHAGSIGGADHRPHRGAGDHRRADAELVERLEDGDMGETVGGPAAEGERPPSAARPAAGPQPSGLSNADNDEIAAAEKALGHAADVVDGDRLDQAVAAVDVVDAESVHLDGEKLRGARSR